MTRAVTRAVTRLRRRCLFVLFVNLIYLIATCAYDGIESMSVNPMIGPCATAATLEPHRCVWMIR